MSDIPPYTVPALDRDLWNCGRVDTRTTLSRIHARLRPGSMTALALAALPGIDDPRYLTARELLNYVRNILSTEGTESTLETKGATQKPSDSMHRLARFGVVDIKLVDTEDVYGSKRLYRLKEEYRKGWFNEAT